MGVPPANLRAAGDTTASTRAIVAAPLRDACARLTEPRLQGLANSRQALNAWRLFVPLQRKWTSGGAPVLVAAHNCNASYAGTTRLQSASEPIKQEIYFAMQTLVGAAFQLRSASSGHIEPASLPARSCLLNSISSG